ncbi:hypothetical protein K469DRAFT_707678 [Zopfia rhizophila CBS 207.26]|uniref:Uncharacterized protein n=1 Tax=Zopfia rhizophila CBS 207.26 TaxID=1314779 RepID=A0A6A6E0W2_9PEZI|nr:hypothetical protein K469DRAFT_707678 [Zopfia rhizophila CBS 207.26]
MSSPYANYGKTFFSVEYRVNGVWNNLLSQFWKTGAGNHDFQISPEAYPKPEDTKGLKADLLISVLVSNGSSFSISTPVLAYEGKGANGDEFPKIFDQLWKWLQEAAELGQFDCWAIGTRGSEVAFLIWQKDVLQWLQWKGNQPTPVFDEFTYDITKNKDWETVLLFLEFFHSHPF